MLTLIRPDDITDAPIFPEVALATAVVSHPQERVAAVAPLSTGLTLQERNELEAAFDGPVTPQAVEDKIRGRQVRTYEVVSDEIATWMTSADQYVADMGFYRQKDNHAMVRVSAEKMNWCLANVTTLENERDAIRARDEAPLQHAAE